MALLPVAIPLVVSVGALLGAGILTMVGPAAISRALADLRPRLRAAAPHVGLLGAVVLLRIGAAGLQVWLAWNVGIGITGWIYAVEGEFVAVLQSVQMPALTEYFVVTYLYGYVFLLAFPIMAYFCLDDRRPLSTLLVAFAVNYGVGLLLYTLFVAYGPRNLYVAEQLLYSTYPQSRVLTNAVNENVNVFPSLHTSLSVTVALLAWRTREQYPVWAPIALLLSASVAVSTMYLGIHWAIDVLAGAALGAWSVLVAERIVASELELRGSLP